jgi:hypothetical protein
MPKLLKNVAGDLTEEATVPVSAGPTSAGKVPELDSTGHLDVTLMPVGYGTDVITGAVAGEALTAGDMVYLDSTGKYFRADANTISKAAQGYVMATTPVNGTTTVYLGDTNTAVTGLTPGLFYFLSAATPGKLVPATSLPVGTGKIIQRLGFAQSTTALHLNIQQTPFILA